MKRGGEGRENPSEDPGLLLASLGVWAISHLGVWGIPHQDRKTMALIWTRRCFLDRGVLPGRNSPQHIIMASSYPAQRINTNKSPDHDALKTNPS